MSKFGNYEAGSYWTPHYGGVDWELRRDRLVEQGDLETYRPIGFDSGDGLIQEITQENCSIFLNEVNPAMDMVAVDDPRDEKNYVWFREQNPDNFARLIGSIGRAATRYLTFYPIEAVVDAYLDRAEHTYE